MKEWTKEPLGELCSLITDGKHGDCQNEEASGYYFISCKDVKNGRVHYEGARQITHSDFAETHRRTDLKAGDVLLTNSGTIGRLAVAADDEKTCRTTFQKSVAILKPIANRITPHFLYYSLAANRSRLINAAGGAAQKNLLLGELRRFPIKVPSLSQQTMISAILSAYDDLIEINRRRIQLLEQAARLLYKEWFVHLRFPGHEHVKIVDDVPEGWETGTISDFFDSTSGGTPSRKHPEYYGGRINWAKTQELDELFILQTDEQITESAVANSAAKVYPAGTLLVAIYGGTNIGRTALLGAPSASNQACVAFFPKRHEQDNLLLQKWVQYNRDYLIGLAQGAAQTNISQKTLKSLEFVLPKKSLRIEFLERIFPAYEQIRNLVTQNENLIRARDLLLLRLMSGEVAV